MRRRIQRPIPRKRRAFTLIELLAVIAIIALLAALLMPSLATARQRAYQVACQNNLRQIGVAIHAYAGANHGLIPHVGDNYIALCIPGAYLPSPPYAANSHVPGAAWYQFLGAAGYLGKMEVFKGKMHGYIQPHWRVMRCPGEVPTAQYPSLLGTTYWENDWVCSSYLYNWYISNYDYYLWYCTCGGGIYYCGGPPAGSCCNLYPFRRLHEPDGTMVYSNFTSGATRAVPVTMENATMVVDIKDYGPGWGFPYYHVDIDSPGFYWTNQWYYGFRHLGRINVLYLDGHADSRDHWQKTGEPLFTPNWLTAPHY